uniref:Uncharacterized protein n=1 Tax=Anaerobacillus isosaccharinicus TaxID=1532552 RepID=A0A1S2LHH2_9BACI
MYIGWWRLAGPIRERDLITYLNEPLAARKSLNVVRKNNANHKKGPRTSIPYGHLGPFCLFVGSDPSSTKIIKTTF